MNPQEATEHDYPHDEEDCEACGGSEQIEIVFQDHRRDYVGCPLCLAQDKNETIAKRDAEIERLRAALADAGAYVALCPPPPEAQGELRIELLERRARIANAALAHD